MAANLSELLSRPLHEHYAQQYTNDFAQDAQRAGTAPEYFAIAADAYGRAQASKLGDLRVSTKVADVAGKARAVGENPDPHLIKAAQTAVELGRSKVIGTTPVELRPSGPGEHVIVTLDQLVQQKRLQEELERARKKPSGIKRA